MGNMCRWSLKNWRALTRVCYLHKSLFLSYFSGLISLKNLINHYNNIFRLDVNSYFPRECFDSHSVECSCLGEERVEVFFDILRKWGLRPGHFIPNVLLFFQAWSSKICILNCILHRLLNCLCNFSFSRVCLKIMFMDISVLQNPRKREKKITFGENFVYAWTSKQNKSEASCAINAHTIHESAFYLPKSVDTTAKINFCLSVLKSLILNRTLREYTDSQ